MERNNLVGAGFLALGSTLVLGSILAITVKGFPPPNFVPVAAFGFALAVIGTLEITLVPGWQAAPQDAFKGLLKDSITNVEAILEELGLRNRAYFIKMEDGDVRAFVPRSTGEGQPASNVVLLYEAPLHFIVDYKGLRGIILIAPGNEIVKLAKVEKGANLEEALRSTLVDYANLAEGVLAIEDPGGKMTKIQITRPQLSLESPYFNDSFGSPVSCVAACVVAAAKGVPIRVVEEKWDPASVSLTLESVQTYLPARS